MIAPALLASGMLVAKFTGYEDMAQGSVIERGGKTESRAAETESRAAEATGPAAVQAPLEIPAPAEARLPARPDARPPAEATGASPARTPLGPDRARRDTEGQGATAPGEPRAGLPSDAADRPAGPHRAHGDERGGVGVTAAGAGGGTARRAAPRAPQAPQVPQAPRTAAGKGTVAAPGRGAHAEVLDPTLVPGPVRVYEGLIRIERAAPPPAARQATPVQRRPAVAPPKEPKEPEPKTEGDDPLICAPQWRDTWLWELCREQGGT